VRVEHGDARAGFAVDELPVDEQLVLDDFHRGMRP
jgi:hypothetical protein